MRIKLDIYAFNTQWQLYVVHSNCGIQYKSCIILPVLKYLVKHGHTAILTFVLSY
jgi:hypothetical protein